MSVFRWTVPVDDRWHQVAHTGMVGYVGSRIGGQVEFWTVEPVVVHQVSDGTGRVISEYDEPADRRPRDHWYRVYGTGMESEGVYVGTTYDGDTRDLVWHLFARQSDPTDTR